ncbi:hypothetical protein thsrh120_54140 [Rhizobium sp. No.120]
MIDAHAALGHHLFQITQAEILGKIPANAQQDHGSIKMAAFEHVKLPRKRSKRHAANDLSKKFATEPSDGD